MAILLPKINASLYHSFIRLSADEMKLLRLCFQNAAISDDHKVMLKLGESVVTYSAFELALGLVGLLNHQGNRNALADDQTFAAVYNMIVTGSMELKDVSVQLMNKLVVGKADSCSLVLENHPNILEVLPSLCENDAAADSLKQHASHLLEVLLGGVSGVAYKEEVKRKVFSNGTASLLNLRANLNRLLTWATSEMTESKVLHNSADEERPVVVVSLMILTSCICEMQHFEGSDILINATLQNYPEFLLVLKDFMQRHFVSKFTFTY